MLSYRTRIDQYLSWKLLGNCLRVMQHLYFAFRNKPAVLETSSWYWRRGTENSACTCSYQRAPQSFLSASDLLLVPWPKLSTVVIPGTSPSYPFLLLGFSYPEPSSPQWKDTERFSLSTLCLREENIPNPSQTPKRIRKPLPMVLLQVAVLCKSSDRGKGSEGVWTSCTSAVTCSHLTFSCPLFLWLQWTPCSMHWNDSGELCWS